MNNGRWEAAQNGYATLAPANNLAPKDITADTPKFIAEYADFYRAKRGFHPRAVNSNPQGAWATTVPLAFINMPILQHAGELRAPALIVHGEKVHSRYFSEDAFKSLGSKTKSCTSCRVRTTRICMTTPLARFRLISLSSSLRRICIKVV